MWRKWGVACDLSPCGLLYNGSDNASGAQTERWGGAGPVRGFLVGKDLTGRFIFSSFTS
jgi:hypothetical protein